VDIRERYRFLRHCDRLLMWQIETIEKERRTVNRILRKNYRKSLVNRALGRVITSNRALMTKIFLDGSRGVW
jgi:hypothetical protein